MPDKRREIEKRIVDGALALVAAQGWNATSLTEIARAAKVTPAQLHGYFPLKAAILTTYISWLDADVLGDGPGEGDSPRERLFDVIMRGLDALGEHKDAVRAVMRDLPRDPFTAIALLARARISLTWVLEAAGISSSGLVGECRLKGLALVYMAVLRVWRHDDSDDLAKTMAALDRQLRRAESVVESLNRRPCGPRERDQEAV